MKLQTSDVKVASGEVEAAAQNSETRYGVRIGGLWFNGFGKCPVERGCNINLKYVERNGFRNIVSIDVPLKLSEPVPGAIRPDAKERLVVYSVALKAAASCWRSAEGLSSVGVKKLAENFAEWLFEMARPPAKINGSTANAKAGDD